MKRSVLPAAAFTIFSICMFSSSTGAIALYDNLDQLLLEGIEGDYINVLDNDRLHAQQFLLSSRSHINRVSVRLARQGDVTGSVAFELWDDAGVNTPGAKVADLGAVPDVTVLSENSSLLTFETFVDGLIPNDPYWVVLNYSGLAEPLTFTESVGWMISVAPHRVFTPEADGYEVDLGTNGAAFLHGFRDTGPWVDLKEAFGLDGLYTIMSVESLPTPSVALLAAPLIALFGLARRPHPLNGARG